MALREWFESTGGKVVAGVLLVVALIAIVLAVRNVFGPPSEVARANTRTFVDVATGRPFAHELKPGEVLPVKAPSGQQSGYPAEMCWWTADGQIRNEPFPVALEEQQGKDGPTFCPDCGRLVRGHNPVPQEGDKPPPKKDEYKPRQDQDR